MFRFLILSSLSLFLITSCNEDTLVSETYEPCIEGWIEDSTGEEIYYRRCIKGINKETCEKTFKIFLNVSGNWPDGPGILTISSISGGIADQLKTEVPIGRQILLFAVNLDPNIEYRHEVTLELPTDYCTINDQAYSSTLKPEVACQSYADVLFNICSN